MITSVETEGGNNLLAESSAYKNFQAEIKDGCEETPVTVELNEMGLYSFSN